MRVRAVGQPVSARVDALLYRLQTSGLLFSFSLQLQKESKHLKAGLRGSGFIDVLSFQRIADIDLAWSIASATVRV